MGRPRWNLLHDAGELCLDFDKSPVNTESQALIESSDK